MEPKLITTRGAKIRRQLGCPKPWREQVQGRRIAATKQTPANFNRYPLCAPASQSDQGDRREGRGRLRPHEQAAQAKAQLSAVLDAGENGGEVVGWNGTVLLMPKATENACQILTCAVTNHSAWRHRHCTALRSAAKPQALLQGSSCLQNPPMVRNGGLSGPWAAGFC